MEVASKQATATGTATAKATVESNANSDRHSGSQTPNTTTENRNHNFCTHSFNGRRPEVDIIENSNVAYLYESVGASGWSHSMPWEAGVLIELKHCPASGVPVGMICDGLVVAAASFAANDDTNHPSGSGSTKPTESGRVVRFRFGKKTYQLSMSIAVAKERTEGPEDPSLLGLGLGWSRKLASVSWWFGFGFGGTHGAVRVPANNDNDNNARGGTGTQTEILAQDRIADALDLAGLKILHKGSLLYDSTITTTTAREQDALVSRALLKISEDDWNWRKTKKKATLVVMGTPRENQNRWWKHDAATSATTNRKSGSSLLQGLKRSMTIPGNFLWWSFKLSWHLVLSFFRPILPPRMMGDSNNNSVNDHTALRPHQD